MLLLVVSTIAIVVYSYHDLDKKKVDYAKWAREKREANEAELVAVAHLHTGYLKLLTDDIYQNPTARTYRLFKQLSLEDQHDVLWRLSQRKDWHGWDIMPPADD